MENEPRWDAISKRSMIGAWYLCTTLFTSLSIAATLNEDLQNFSYQTSSDNSLLRLSHFCHFMRNTLSFINSPSNCIIPFYLQNMYYLRIFCILVFDPLLVRKRSVCCGYPATVFACATFYEEQSVSHQRFYWQSRGGAWYLRTSLFTPFSITAT